MIVSNNPAFIYARVPKTASTSLRAALEPFRRPEDGALLGKIGRRLFPKSQHARLVNFRAHAHFPLSAAQQILPPEFFQNALKIVSVRHPFDWLQSLYRHVERNRDNPRFFALYEEFYSDPTLPNFIAFLSRRPVPPQAAYAVGENGEVLADFVVRFETLEEDTKALSARLGHELSVPTLNKAPDPLPLDFGVDEQAAVQELYKIDFDLFGYGASGIAGPALSPTSERTKLWAARAKRASSGLALADFRPDLDYADLPAAMRWAG